MNMMSKCDITNSAHQIQMTTVCHWVKTPQWNFLRAPLLSNNGITMLHGGIHPYHFCPQLKVSYRCHDEDGRKKRNKFHI